MKQRKTMKIALPAGTILFLLFVWEFFVRLTNTPLYILPAPSKVLLTLVEEAPTLWQHSIVTLSETVAGLLIALVLAMILAILMDAFGLFRLAIYPLLVVSQTIPVIVLAPLFIIYLGFGMAPKILTVVLMCFFPIVISFADGMAQLDTNQVNLVRSFGAGWAQVYRLVKIPGAAPSLFSGLKVAATYSVTGAVVGEWLSSDSGLGYYMLRVKNAFMLDKVFACVLVIIFLSLIMNGVVRVLHYALFPHLRQQNEEE
ncbi:MAG: ABC transporter permease [Anaerovoracaceae bacterium]|jgi:putative hydroxymethylpyrimidine transport system permease protein